MSIPAGGRKQKAFADKKQVCVFGPQKLRPSLRLDVNLLFAPVSCKKGKKKTGLKMTTNSVWNQE